MNRKWWKQSAAVSPNPPMRWYTCRELTIVSGHTEASPKKVASWKVLPSIARVGSRSVARIEPSAASTMNALPTACRKNQRVVPMLRCVALPSLARTKGSMMARSTTTSASSTVRLLSRCSRADSGLIGAGMSGPNVAVDGHSASTAAG